MQCAWTIFSSVAFSAVQCFSTLSHKGQIFEKKTTYFEHQMCVLIFCTKFAWKMSHSKKNLARYYQRCILVFMYFICMLFLYGINEIRISSTNFGKILKYHISWKSVFWEPSCFMRKDGRTDGEIDRLTDVAKLSVTFLNFASSPKKHIAIQHCWIYTCFNLHINLLVESNV